jgi:hypothetical protein
VRLFVSFEETESGEATVNLPLIAVVALAGYRIWRFLALDDWPPIRTAREKLLARWGDSPWAEGLTCAWCIGSLIVAALWAGVALLESVRLPGLQALASATVTGLIARWED